MHEADRLAALKRYQILDTPREQEVDDIVAIAADLRRFDGAQRVTPDGNLLGTLYVLDDKPRNLSAQ